MASHLAQFTAASEADLAPMRLHIGERLRRSRMAEDRVEDALVMTSELVTNALVHARCSADVVVDVDLAGIRVGVTDDSSTAPRPRPVDPTRVGGNGLRIVAAFADDWGSLLRLRRSGKEVWFRLAW